MQWQEVPVAQVVPEVAGTYHRVEVLELVVKAPGPVLAWPAVVVSLPGLRVGLLFLQ